MRFRIKKVDPIGVRRGHGIACHADGTSSVGPLERPEYPPSPGGESMRKARVDAGVSFLGLRQAAARLGLTAEQLSGLEVGRYTFEDHHDFEAAGEILAGRFPRRTDGWPFCPVCGEDELGCLDTDYAALAAGGLVEYLRRELFCYLCSRKYPPGTFSAPEVKT